MSKETKAYLVGGGIGSLAAAAFMIRDGKLPGGNISILEAAPVMGGSLDGAGDPADGGAAPPPDAQPPIMKQPTQATPIARARFTALALQP